jgi:hypothetical protein
MAKCPNCDQKAARTEDWACQWCGYPLLSRSYKRLTKTYQQLKEERRPDSKPERREEAAPVLEVEPEPEPAAEPEPEPVVQAKPEPDPVPEFEPEPAAEPELDPVPELEPKSAAATIVVTAEELVSAYETDEVAADARFSNQILKVTGVVDRIEVRDIHDIRYITLTNAEKDLLQTVRCTFDSQHVADLNQLTEGQTVTVQGKYDGSMIDISIKDCLLVH